MSKNTRNSSRIILLTVLAAVGLALSAAAHAQDSFQGLGALPDSFGGNYARAASADGSVVVGLSYYIAPGGLLQSHAFRWTKESGMHALFADGLDYTSAAFSISANGLAIGGWHALTIIEEQAFIWSAAGGEEQLATRSGVLALSATGEFGAGYVARGHETGRATLWDGGRSQTFIDSPGVIIPGSQARGISADGSVAVGQASFMATNGLRAFRWTAASGIQNLGSPDAGGPLSEADAITADGSVIVGAAQSVLGGPFFAAKWTSSSGTQIVGTLPGAANTVAYAVSSDGGTIVGASGGRAFIWRAATGMQDLQTLINPPAGWTLTEARAISTSGNIVVGSGSLTGVGAQAWIAKLPCFPVNGPASVTTCSSGAASFSVSATGAGPFSYRWQWTDTAQPVWTNVMEGTNSGPSGDAIFSATGAVNDSLVITPPPLHSSYISSNLAGLQLRCLVSNSCGDVVSSVASLNLCAADFNCDMATDFFDYLDFVDAFSLGNPAADFNNDTIVDFFDYLDFIDVFSRGC